MCHEKQAHETQYDTDKENPIYYHCRPLKYVEYGKVFPHSDDDNALLPAYKWLGHYCGYCPQLWLSRGNRFITGYREGLAFRAAKGATPAYRRKMRDKKDNILFGFDLIQGFPVDYSFWWGCALNVTMNMPKATFEEQNQRMAHIIDSCFKTAKEYYPEEIEMGLRPSDTAWERTRNFDAYLKAYVFVERDQIVVPSLNLNAAKKVVCRDEKQKKALRRMGFIEDRIEIRNAPG